jgi:hypothetical protein
MPINLNEHASRVLGEGKWPCRIKSYRECDARHQGVRYIDFDVITKDPKGETMGATHRVYVPEGKDWEYRNVGNLAVACQIPSKEMANFGERYSENWDLFLNRDVVIIIRAEEKENGKVYNNATYFPIYTWEANKPGASIPAPQPASTPSRLPISEPEKLTDPGNPFGTADDDDLPF